MRVFFDANVILDWLRMREPTWGDSIKAIRKTIERGDIALLSAASINDIHYVLRKAVGSSSIAKEKLVALLSLFSVAKVDESVISTAATFNGNDFEDDICVATAIVCNADCIVTNNIKDFKRYSDLISVFTPSIYLSVSDK